MLRGEKKYKGVNWNLKDVIRLLCVKLYKNIELSYHFDLADVYKIQGM